MPPPPRTRTIDGNDRTTRGAPVDRRRATGFVRRRRSVPPPLAVRVVRGRTKNPARRWANGNSGSGGVGGTAGSPRRANAQACTSPLSSSSCGGNEDRSIDGTGATAPRSILPPPSRISFAAWALDSPSPSSGRFPSRYFPPSSPSSATTRKSTISIVSASPDSSTEPSSLRRTSSSSRLVHQSSGAVTETCVQ